MSSRLGIVLCAALSWAGPVLAEDSPTQGGGAATLPADSMSDQRRAEIEQATAESIARLRAEGRLERSAEGLVPFRWPVAPWSGLSEPGYHGISNYVDQDERFPGFLLDFDCGARSYDLSNGYNHRGTDIFSWPNPWKYMAEDKIAVVAGAPGVIVFKEDGHPDMSCGFNSLPWNAVYVRQDDGTIAWYGHLKQASATPRAVGERVEPGEYLGIMGSSGSSTGPHLHFELWRDESYTELLDPWLGTCNLLDDVSRWVDQRPYFDPGVNQLTVGTVAPVATPACPTIESPNERYDVAGGQQVVFTMYVRDYQPGQQTALAILRPDGSVWDAWTHTGPQYYAASWWWWSRFVPDAPAGTWSFRVTYDGEVSTQRFNVGLAAAGSLSGTAGDSLTVDKVDFDTFALRWGDSCNSADSDYVIYEGDIGDFTSHTPAACSTAGEQQWSLDVFGAARYWLIAPRNAQREGGLGTDSAGFERPQPALTGDRCLERAFDCPVALVGEPTAQLRTTSPPRPGRGRSCRRASARSASRSCVTRGS